MRHNGAVAAQRVLVVEDDATVADVVCRYLARDGYDVERSGDGAEALELALADPPDLMVLDIMLPGMDGLTVCRRLRALAPVPVILLTARSDDADRIIGLELGADDYVVKPFSPRELVARVKAVLRRVGASPAAAHGSPPMLEGGNIRVDIVAREAYLDGARVALRARELELLAFMMRHPRRAFTRETLFNRVWGYDHPGDTNVVDVHISHLRDKLGADARLLIRTIYGVGYSFRPDELDP